MNPDFNSGFFLTIVGIVTAFLSGSLVYCIKSKCTKCSLCYGLIDIQRDVDVEEKIEEAELEKGINPYSSPQERK
jgi:hypothetical protein